MAKDPVIVIRGELHWAKLTGSARPHTGNPKYDKGPYWSVDVTPDARSLEVLKKLKLTKKLREPGEKDERKEDFLSLKVLENKADGGKNSPPTVVDVKGQPWDGRLIGNKTIADVKIKVKDYGPGSEKGTYLQAVRILDLVPYEVKAFDELDEDDEFFAGAVSDEEPDAKGESPEADELDDDIPF